MAAGPGGLVGSDQREAGLALDVLDAHARWAAEEDGERAD
jgi:hypothetical protein